MELGFDAVGVCSAEVTAWMRHLEGWLDQGCHGTMAFMEQHRGIRLDPNQYLPGARSVVMVAKGYGRPEANAPVSAGSGVMARYARGRDYHEVIRKRLRPLVNELRKAGFEARAFVDSAPVMEKAYGWRAGLGGVGKNQLLIHPRLGSYILLGGVMTDAELKADAPGPEPYSVCGDCNRCVRLCPAQALHETFLDATQCLSYWTVEQKTELLPSGIAEVMGSRVFGCDGCQEVCPHNAKREYGDASMFAPFLGDGGWSFEEWKGLGAEGFAQRFAGTSVKRTGWERVLRNVEAAAAAQEKRTQEGPLGGGRR